MSTPSSTPSSARSAGKLLWLRAGQELLRTGGIGAVKIHALQAETGLTTGSFYHHFAGMSAYLEELASFWGGDTAGHLQEADDPDPQRRLRKLAAIAPREELFRLDLAMRDWAGSDVAAAAAVRSVDEILLNFVAQAFSDIGFGETDARLRAQTWMATGVARIAPPWPAIDDASDRLIDLLVGPNT